MRTFRYCVLIALTDIATLLAVHWIKAAADPFYMEGLALITIAAGAGLTGYLLVRLCERLPRP